MANVRVLGPYVDGVIEPDPATSAAPATPGRQQIIFDTPATTPGGNVFMKLVPPSTPNDIPPIMVYLFHVPQPTVPPPATRTPEWFFASGAPNNSVHVGTADAAGKFSVVVPGVKPSLVPYHVQSIVEYNS